jgi:hypothetical protein
MQKKSLAVRLGQPGFVASDMLAMHRIAYPVFHKWSRRIVEHAGLCRVLETCYGWQVHLSNVPGERTNPRSLANHPMQAGCAEILRLACCLGTESGIEIVAPVHDAVMIHAPLDVLDDHVTMMRGYMRTASTQVLDGFELYTDCVKVPDPTSEYLDRYMDTREYGAPAKMWERIMRLLERAETDHVKI